jgi:acyl-CoA synthetase (NDP forming)
LDILSHCQNYRGRCNPDLAHGHMDAGFTIMTYNSIDELPKSVINMKEIFKNFDPWRYEVDILNEALKEGRTTLSEYESKKLLSEYGIPISREMLVGNETGLREAIGKIGFPLVIKACAPNLSHKTERGLVSVDIRNEIEAISEFQRIMADTKDDGASVLVQEMVRGQRELVMGLTRDIQFGPCVMFGLGGIFTEILKDVSFRVAPIEKRDALDMMGEIKARKILDAVRGMPPADMDSLAEMLISVGNMGLEQENIKEIDINPVILAGSRPIAVDALVVLINPPGGS